MSVDGVTHAEVSFERREAQVEYDPRRCAVEDLIAAVAKGKDPSMPTTFRATVKQ